MHGGYRLNWPDGVKHTVTRDWWFDKFSQLPPGMNLQEIAAEMGEAYATIYRWADLFRYSFPDLRREGRVSCEQWERIDWLQRDAEIARELGVSRERVRQVRALRGMGPSAHRHMVRQFTKWVNGNRDRLHCVPVCEVVKAFNRDLSPQVARRLLRAHGVKPHDPASRWRGIDWRLPNRDLARIWATSAKYIANVRARLKVGRALWDAKTSKIADNVHYQKALAQEMIQSGGSRKAMVRPRKTALVEA